MHLEAKNRGCHKLIGAGAIIGTNTVHIHLECKILSLRFSFQVTTHVLPLILLDSVVQWVNYTYKVKQRSRSILICVLILKRFGKQFQSPECTGNLTFLGETCDIFSV